MTRHLLAFAAATAFGAAAIPAAAQDGPPPPPEWADPQAPHYPPPVPRDGYGAPFAHPLPSGVYPQPYPPQAVPYPGGPEPYHGGPMVWQGDGEPAYGSGGGYWYAYQSGAPSCGCPAYTWMPVPIETRYSYSAPRRHVQEVVEEKVVRDTVVEPKIVPARPATKYVKARPPKVTKSKVVRSTK
jgi:hypothetical protein